MIRTLYAALAAVSFWISEHRVASSERWKERGNRFDKKAGKRTALGHQGEPGARCDAEQALGENTGGAA